MNEKLAVGRSKETRRKKGKEKKKKYVLAKALPFYPPSEIRKQGTGLPRTLPQERISLATAGKHKCTVSETACVLFYR